MELKKEPNNDLQVVWITIYIFKNNRYFHSTAETRSLIEEHVETLSEAQERDPTQKQQTASHGQPLRAILTIPEPDQVLNIHLNSW